MIEGFYDVTLFDCPPFRMFHVNDCPRAVDILKHKRFEPASMALWCKLARTATSIIDIGAQVGVYSLAAAALRQDIEIHAFEPNPFAYARLELHRQINGFKNIRVYPYALGRSEGVTNLSWRDKGHISSGSQVREPGADDTSVPVKVHPLHSIRMNIGERPLVKIDVEGFEVEVLLGAAGLFLAAADIIIESFNQQHCDEIHRLCQQLNKNYIAYKINERGGLTPTYRLLAADPHGEDFNSFLTTRPLP